MLWFDLDNSPHVPLFRPILAKMDELGVPYHVTARNFAQTLELLTLWGIPHTAVGSHGGKNRFRKVLNLIRRSSDLLSHVKAIDVDLAISHGSRTQVVASRRSGIPSVVMLDYEYTETRLFNLFASQLLMPSMIPADRLRQAGFNLRKVIRYDGFKEEIYLQDFVPLQGFRSELGVDEKSILVTIRPPSTTGNYHDDKSESLFSRCLEHCSSVPGVHVLIVNRTAQETALFSDALRRVNVHILKKPVDGLQLLWQSDVVISGGGTMNREAALLGAPTFSIFTGRRPYLDELLQEQGRLKFVGSDSDVKAIPVSKRSIPKYYSATNKGIVENVVQQLLDLKQSLPR